MKLLISDPCPVSSFKGMVWLLTPTGIPCMSSNVNSIFHSIVYISVIYVWDKVETVHWEFVTLISLWKYMLFSDNHACAEGTGVHCCMQQVLCGFRY